MVKSAALLIKAKLKFRKGSVVQLFGTSKPGAPDAQVAVPDDSNHGDFCEESRTKSPEKRVSIDLGDAEKVPRAKRRTLTVAVEGAPETYEKEYETSPVPVRFVSAATAKRSKSDFVEKENLCEVEQHAGTSDDTIASRSNPRLSTCSSGLSPDFPANHPSQHSRSQTLDARLSLSEDDDSDDEPLMSALSEPLELVLRITPPSSLSGSFTRASCDYGTPSPEKQNQAMHDAFEAAASACATARCMAPVATSMSKATASPPPSTVIPWFCSRSSVHLCRLRSMASWATRSLAKDRWARCDVILILAHWIVVGKTAVRTWRSQLSAKDEALLVNLYALGVLSEADSKATHEHYLKAAADAQSPRDLRRQKYKRHHSGLVTSHIEMAVDL
mmetsp:Transcript_16291/g.34939  ORF Transcript_16291/g.34939 Transcript_16291/m.34939 type:complete len:388 (-) Transcript_16291:330-1493(-)